MRGGSCPDGRTASSGRRAHRPPASDPRPPRASPRDAARGGTSGSVEGYDVITSDEHKLGHVVGTIGDNVIVEHGTLRKTKHAVPRAFVHADDAEEVVRLTITKELVEESPK